jgi:hypothetical protein
MKKLHIIIPLSDVILQIPSYAKFLKILFSKRKLQDCETVALNMECSVMVQSKVAPKMKDPESFTIPCVISSTPFKNVLYDLGASVSLMP